MLISLAFFKPENSIAQNKINLPKKNCKNTVLEFYSLAKAEDYVSAYPLWVESFKNCSASSKMIYKYGLKIVEDRYQNAIGAQKLTESMRIDSIFSQRIQYFPENLGKVYSDWATSLDKRGANKDEVSEKLTLAFNADPTQMSIKNIEKYFQQITDKHKDSNPQKVFDIYDTVLEAVNKKIDIHSKSKDELDKKVADGGTLTEKEARNLKNNIIILRGLGQLEMVIDYIHGDVTSCERLIPLYTKEFETRKNDVKWLRRAVSRLKSKECADEAIFSKLVEAYWEIDSSLDAYIRGCRVLDYDQTKDLHKVRESIEAEKDPYKRAEYYYKIAYGLKRKNKSLSRNYAYKALKERPSLGKAYLLIGILYASSANGCGTDEISKRMVFVAAANKARMAKKVDPSLTSKENRYIKSYISSMPRTWPGQASGKDFEIKCWIGETVKIP